MSLPYSPVVFLLFFGSGCAALIYEIVWLQLLQLVIGSTAASLGVLLGTFMGGMCLGSLLFPHLVGRTRHPLRVYAGLELAIGGAGLILLFGMPFVNDLYIASGNSLVVRAAVAAICLLAPTFLMGATLPAISRWVATSRGGVARLGFFYAGNLAGAVAGSAVAGFYLLRLYDLAITTYVAVAINMVIAITSLVIARRSPRRTPDAETGAWGAPLPGSWLVYITIALSGLTALSCEVVWTRLLSLAFGGTVYTFSLIVAVFLSGLGIGGGIGAALSRRDLCPRPALGWCQILLCAAMAWAAFLLTRIIPTWPIAEYIRNDFWLGVQVDLVRCLLVVLPGALLWGASFPLALAAVASAGQDPGRIVGGIYAANTAGAIAGALGTSLIMTASFGSQHTQQGLIIISAVSGAAVLATRRRGVGALIAAGAAGLLAITVAPVPGALVAYGRRSAGWISATRLVNGGRILYVGEGSNAFLAVSRGASGELNYHAAGKVQASTRAEDMRLQLMLAHFSALVPRRPADVLVIGCGAGITAGALSIAPDVAHLTIAEIERLVPSVASTYFGDYNAHVIESPKVTLRIDDGRHFLGTTDEKFDVITTDLIDPWVKGIATLFTREFFETAKHHLRAGGVVTQFVQLYQSNIDAVKSEIATFVETFPNAVVWGNPSEGKGYDLVLMGQVEPIRIDIDEWQARLDRPEYAAVAASLRSIGFSSAVQLLSTYAGSTADLGPWLSDAMINRDRNLRLQYLAGLGVGLDEGGPIYLDMLRLARFPDHMFTGSAASIRALQDGIAHSIGHRP